MPASVPLADRQEVPSRTVRAVAKEDILEADMMEKKGDDDEVGIKYRLSTVSSIFMHNLLFYFDCFKLKSFTSRRLMPRSPHNRIIFL